jgi:hypothetical protein
MYFVSNEIKGYVMYFFGFYSIMEREKKKNLFTVLTEESSIPDDNDDNGTNR